MTKPVGTPQVSDQTPFDDIDDWDSVQVIENDYGVVVRLDGPESTSSTYTGIYEGVEVVEIDTSETPSTIHRFKDQQGNRYSIWGSHDLDGKLKDVTPGHYVRVEYLETVDLTKGRTLKRFKVQAKELPTT